ncbi:MAG TPA: DUF1080 domain-containing protein [Verrucomicrobiae bacterium]|nr:DUF1080 domain-containing protein [Verrucomicrobiae bacterium]
MSNSNRLAIWILCGLFFSACASHSASPPAQPAIAGPEPSQTGAAAPNPAPAPPAKDELKEAAAKPAAPFEGEGWHSMFDGETLTGWRQTAFAGRGEVECRSGLIVLNMGDPFTGINWTNSFPKMNYEIALDAMRTMGADFFCGLTVPVGDSFCSLIVGGWGGSLLGISSLDGMDASENDTTKFVNFESKRWYRIRLRVTQGRIEGWVDDKKLIDVGTTGKRIDLRPGDIEMSMPMGIASWQTSSALREIKCRTVAGPADPPKKEF